MAEGVEQTEHPGLPAALGFVNHVGLEFAVGKMGLVLVVEFRVADDGRTGTRCLDKLDTTPALPRPQTG